MDFSRAVSSSLLRMVKRLPARSNLIRAVCSTYVNRYRGENHSDIRTKRGTPADDRNYFSLDTCV